MIEAFRLLHLFKIIVTEEEDEKYRKRRKTTMTEEEEDEEGQNVVFNNNVRTSARSSPLTFWYTSPTYVPCFDPF